MPPRRLWPFVWRFLRGTLIVSGLVFWGLVALAYCLDASPLRNLDLCLSWQRLSTDARPYQGRTDPPLPPGSRRVRVRW